MLEGVAGRNAGIWQLVKPEKLGKGYVCYSALPE